MSDASYSNNPEPVEQKKNDEVEEGRTGDATPPPAPIEQWTPPIFENIWGPKPAFISQEQTFKLKRELDESVKEEHAWRWRGRRAWYCWPCCGTHAAPRRNGRWSVLNIYKIQCYGSKIWDPVVTFWPLDPGSRIRDRLKRSRLTYLNVFRIRICFAPDPDPAC
jgi:hypothetical protein